MAKLVYSTTKSRLILTDVNGICWESRRNYKGPVEAMRFARMVAANARFADAQVIQAGRSWRVRLYPSSLSRIYSRMMAQTNAAVARDAEVLTYERISPTLWTCRNTESGGTYTVGEASCTCLDYKSRKGKLGAPCKHIEVARRRGYFAQSEAVPVSEAQVGCMGCRGTGEDFDGWSEDGKCPLCHGSGKAAGKVAG